MIRLPFAERHQQHPSVAFVTVLVVAQSLGCTGRASDPKTTSAVVHVGAGRAPNTPRPFRLSGTEEGALKVEKDARSASFVYYESDRGSEVGVWQGRGRAAQASKPPHLNRADYTELMFILEGGVTLAEEDGTELPLKPGDAVIVPRGVPYYWRLPEGQWVKKVDVILDRAKDAPALPYKHLVRMEASGPAGVGLEEVEGLSRGHTYYDSPKGAGAGVWQTRPYVGKAGFVPKKYSEVMIVLRGEGELAQRDGSSLPFHGGDVLLVPKGAAYQWKSQDVQKFWVMFDDDEPSTR